MTTIERIFSKTKILRTCRGLRIILNYPGTLRFVAAPDKDDAGNAYIHLLRLVDAADSRSLDHEAQVLTVWFGPTVIAMDLCVRLISALASPDHSDTIEMSELEAACVAARKPSAPRDLDEDLRTGRDAATTEGDTTP